VSRFKVLDGIHKDKSGKVFKKGQIVESDASLDELCVNKFKRMGVQKRSKKRPSSDEKALGKDVTSFFPAAAKKGLKVFKDKSKQYHVAREGNPTVAISGRPMDRDVTSRFIRGVRS
jgi:hypothetical protein